MAVSDNEIRVSQIEVHTPSADCLEVGATVRGGPGTRLWFRLSGAPTTLEQLTIGPEPFIVGLLWPALSHGSTIRIEQPVERSLVWSINTDVAPLLRSMADTAMPRPGADVVVPRETNESTDSEAVGARRAFTGMSCGIDSLVTLATYGGPEVPPPLRIGGFTFNDVGSHGRSAAATSIHRERLERARAVADSLDIPLLEIKSNLDEFYEGSPFQLTHTLRNAAVALFLRGSASSFLYSSTYGYAGIHCGPTKDSATADPVLLPMLSTPDYRLVSAGAGLSRLKKTLKYLDEPLFPEHLDICTNPLASEFINCGTCLKCGRFLLLAESRGQLQDFTITFDLNRFRENRAQLVTRMSENAHKKLGNPNDLDHLRYLQDRHAVPAGPPQLRRLARRANKSIRYRGANLTRKVRGGSSR